MPSEAEWEKRATNIYVGRKIVKARYMTHDEAEEFGWGSRPIVLELDNGSIIFPSQDDEGNGPGALFGNDRDGNDIGMPVFYR